MIDNGTTVDYLVFVAAVRSQRVDGPGLFFEKATFCCTINEMCCGARETKDKRTKSAVKAGVAKLKGISQMVADL